MLSSAAISISPEMSFSLAALIFFNKYVMLEQHETSTKAGASNDVVYFSKLQTSLQIVICMLFDKFQVIFCTVKCTISQ